jgi:beta-lactamase class A
MRKFVNNRKNLVAGIMLGIIIGVASASLFRSKMNVTTSRELREMGVYHFINPLLECEISDGLIDVRKENFKYDLTDMVRKIMDERKIEIALYYRDLNNGPAFGVKETEGFIPASLLKVPVMMAYYHEAQNNPGVLDTQYTFLKSAAVNKIGTQHISPSHTLQIGNKYSVGELIDQAIIYSDNDAVSILIDHISEPTLRDLYQLLGVSQVAITFSDGRLTVREYASFFRVLFNASYISREYSEKALELLSRIDFKDGLVAGVPNGVVVSHKFGEGGYENGSQIHDCGIIYALNRPYLLCVMTRGSDIATLTKSIADVSRFVYDRVSKQN